MRKKEIFLAILLPVIFGPFGLLYSSQKAGLNMIFLCVILGLTMSFLNLPSNSILLFSIILQPFIIFYSFFIRLSDLSGSKTENNTLIHNSIQHALLVVFASCFFTFFATHLSIHTLSNEAINFYVLIIILTILLCFLISKKQLILNQLK